MSTTAIRTSLRLLADREDLPHELASDAMRDLMSGAVSESHLAALLMGLCCKGETIDEITACAQVMRACAVPIRPSLARRGFSSTARLTDLCGTGGASIKTFNVSTLAALVAAGAALPVAKHGNRGASGPCGSADLMEALGVDLEMDPARTERSIERNGFGFLYAPRYHPSMRHAAPVRRALGLRTIFNLVGPLTNPAGAEAQLLGVHSEPLLDIYPTVLQRLGVERAWVVHGIGGLDELSILGPTEIAELRDGRVRRLRVKPGAVGLKRADRDAIGPFPPAQLASGALSLLSGRSKGPRYEMVLLNAGAALYVGGRAASLEAGLELAAVSLAEGRGRAVLESVVASSRAIAASPGPMEAGDDG